MLEMEMKQAELVVDLSKTVFQKNITAYFSFYRVKNEQRGTYCLVIQSF